MVETKNNEIYEGTMVSSNFHMNLRLFNVTITKSDGSKRECKEAFLRGTSIKAIKFYEDIVESYKQSVARNQRKTHSENRKVNDSQFEDAKEEIRKSHRGGSTESSKPKPQKSFGRGQGGKVVEPIKPKEEVRKVDDVPASGTGRGAGAFGRGKSFGRGQAQPTQVDPNVSSERPQQTTGAGRGRAFGRGQPIVQQNDESTLQFNQPRQQQVQAQQNQSLQQTAVQPTSRGRAFGRGQRPPVQDSDDEEDLGVFRDFKPRQQRRQENEPKPKGKSFGRGMRK